MARLFNHSFPGRKAALFCIEQSLVLVAAFAGAALAAALAREAAGEAGLKAISDGEAFFGDFLTRLGASTKVRAAGALSWALLTTVSAALAMYAADLYDLRQASVDRARGGRRTLVALGVVGAVLFVRAAVGEREERALALGALLAAGLSVYLLRRSLPGLLGKPLRLLVIGPTEKVEAFCASVYAEAETSVELLLREREGSLAEVARACRADWIVAAAQPEGTEGKEWVEARAAGIPCMSASSACERLLRRIPVEDLAATELAFADGFHLTRGVGAAKRALDLLAAGTGLLLAAPLLAAAALAIRWDSPGPIFYRQQRVGWRGHIFEMRKLRTMRVDAEAEGTPRWASENDPRVTRVGRLLRKTRVDEIPQLWSVLRGDMSLVGPRPERPFFVEQLAAGIPWYELRLSVRPGVTGWAQIRFPYGASLEDARRKLEYDLYYVKNGSIFLDVAIVFHTVRHVLTGRGAR